MPTARVVTRRGSHSKTQSSRVFREQGHMLVQLRRSYTGLAREHIVEETASFTDLLRTFYSDISGDRSILPDKLHYEFFLHGQRMTASSGPVSAVLNGGETIYVKVFDEEGVQYVWDRSGWEPKS